MHTPWGPAPSQRCSPRLLQAHRALSRARSTLQAQNDGSNIAQCPGCTRHRLGLHAGLVGGGQDHLNSGAVALSSSVDDPWIHFAQRKKLARDWAVESISKRQGRMEKW
jgi:hypothetical protein